MIVCVLGLPDQNLNKKRSYDYTPIAVQVIGRGYSRFVRVLRWALPMLALMIVGVLIFWLSVDENTQITAQPTPQTQGAEGQTAMIKPKYEGVDGKGRPYRVTADKVSRSSETPEIMRLYKPVADIMLDAKDRAWLAVSSDVGVFHEAKNNLVLQGHVKFFHDTGYELTMDQLVVDLSTSHAKSDKPVQGHGPAGTIAGQKMQILDGGEKIVFQGPAKMVLHSVQ